MVRFRLQRRGAAVNRPIRSILASHFGRFAILNRMFAAPIALIASISSGQRQHYVAGRHSPRGGILIEAAIVVLENG